MLLHFSLVDKKTVTIGKIRQYFDNRELKSFLSLLPFIKGKYLSISQMIIPVPVVSYLRWNGSLIGHHKLINVQNLQNRFNTTNWERNYRSFNWEFIDMNSICYQHYLSILSKNPNSH
jgi:hypothetical protein